MLKGGFDKLLEMKTMAKIGMLLMLVFFLTLSGGIFFQAHAEIPAIERQALIAIYNDTGGNNWTKNDNWKIEKQWLE